jgi:hypothetical protein
MSTNTPITKSALRSIWEIGESFFPSHASRDFKKLNDFILLTGYIQELAPAYSQVVEVGGGDFAYARHLADRKILGRTPFITSDIPSQRVRDARARAGRFRIEEADLLEAQVKFPSNRTLYVAANVLGNVIPEDLHLFFSRLKESESAVAFIAGGTHPDAEEMFTPDKIRYDHNYFRLARKFGLGIHKYYLLFNPERSKSVTYVMALTS